MFFMQMNAQSQDLIFIKNDTINAQIIEIGLEKMIYQEKDMPVKTIRKRDVLRIEYKNGIVEDFGSTNPRKIRPYNIGIVLSKYIFENEMIMAEAEFNYFIKPYFTFSYNAGIDDNLNMFFSVGPRYYINRTCSSNRLTPYIGFQIGRGSNLESLDQSLLLLECPIGLEYISKSGFNFGIKLSPIMVSESPDPFILLGLKFGKNY